MRNESVCRECSLEEQSLQETKEEQSPGAPSTKGTGIVWRNVFWQFLRFCLVGGTNTAIDILTLNILLWSLPTYNALRLVIYNSIAYTVGAVSSCFLNKYCTFRHRQRTTGREVRRFVT